MRGLKERISKDRASFRTQLGLANIWAVPRLDEVVINAGLGRLVTASAKAEEVVERVSAELAAIAGQKPVVTRAKKAISSFKTRLGMPIGLKITLHGRKMYDFLDRFVRMALPRTRDFRGLKESSVDGSGNLTVGVRDHTVFPEAWADAAHTFGFEFTVVVKGSDRRKSLDFFKLLGFPFEGLPPEHKAQLVGRSRR